MRPDQLARFAGLVPSTELGMSAPAGEDFFWQFLNHSDSNGVLTMRQCKRANSFAVEALLTRCEGWVKPPKAFGFMLKVALCQLIENAQLGGFCMQYFVTGATGFIGKRLCVKKLLERRRYRRTFCLRRESEAKVAEIANGWGLNHAKSAARVVAGVAMVTKSWGVSGEVMSRSRARIDHYSPCHLRPGRRRRKPNPG